MEAILLATGTIILFGLVVGILFAWPVQLLWNGCLVGAVSGVHEVTFWQAFGLLILSNILFKTVQSNKKPN